MEFENMLKHYYNILEEEKDLKKKKKPLNEQIKTHMVTSGLEDYTSENGLKAIYKEQERVTLNEDKLVNQLKNLGLTEAILTVEKPDQSVVEDLIYEGKLDPSILDECVEKKIVPVLTVKGVKKK